MTKKQLRHKYKNLRKQLTEEQRDQMSLEIANLALQLDIWEYDYYHIFLPIERLREINTEYLLSILSGKDKHILVSTSDFETNTMRQFLLTDNTKIVLNEYGIPEPENGIEISTDNTQVVFVPLLAYDLKGNRVGYGKGFYDRFLSKCSPDTIKVGLSFFEPETNNIQASSDDISLNYCITGNKVYAF